MQLKTEHVLRLLSTIAVSHVPVQLGSSRAHTHTYVHTRAHIHTYARTHSHACKNIRTHTCQHEKHTKSITITDRYLIMIKQAPKTMYIRNTYVYNS